METQYLKGEPNATLLPGIYKNKQTKTTAVNRYRGITYNVCVQNVICIETN